MKTRIARILIVTVVGVVVLMLAGTATGTGLHVLTVDGTEHTPTKVSGPTVHYETPDTNPTTAFTERNAWTGNGREHLPCENGIHWIDNQNVLTVSHCLGGPSDPSTTTTTTTEPPTTTFPTTTTTMVGTTTTDPTPSSTTSTTDPTTTSTTSTSLPDPTTSTVPPTTVTPKGGVATGAGGTADGGFPVGVLSAVGLMGLLLAGLYAWRQSNE